MSRGMGAAGEMGGNSTKCDPPPPLGSLGTAQIPSFLPVLGFGVSAPWIPSFAHHPRSHPGCNAAEGETSAWGGMGMGRGRHRAAGSGV